MHVIITMLIIYLYKNPVSVQVSCLSVGAI